MYLIPKCAKSCWLCSDPSCHSFPFLQTIHYTFWIPPPSITDDLLPFLISPLIIFYSHWPFYYQNCSPSQSMMATYLFHFHLLQEPGSYLLSCMDYATWTRFKYFSNLYLQIFFLRALLHVFSLKKPSWWRCPTGALLIITLRKERGTWWPGLSLLEVSSQKGKHTMSAYILLAKIYHMTVLNFKGEERCSQPCAQKKTVWNVVE